MDGGGGVEEEAAGWLVLRKSLDKNVKRKVSEKAKKKKSVRWSEKEKFG